MSTEVEDALRKEIEASLRVTLEAEYAEKLAKKSHELDEENNRIIGRAIEEWNANQKNKQLTPEQLEKLLSQEYVTFPVKVMCTDDSGEMKERTFTLVELPQAVEKKFYKMFKDKVKPHIARLAELVREVEGGKMDGKIETILELFDPAFDMLAAATAIVLNPYGKQKDVDEKWCAENLSSIRMWNIISAQEQINKLRSFFSRLSPTSLGSLGR